jgi:hypothetical protein
MRPAALWGVSFRSRSNGSWREAAVTGSVTFMIQDLLASSAWVGASLSNVKSGKSSMTRY